MKKILTFLVAIVLSSSILFAQPVSDNAVIPVAVTLTSILRLNVVSGGNIEFAVNTLDQYNTGIANSARYDTKFTVASSVDFDVFIYAEDATLMGSDATGTNINTMPLNNIGFIVESTGGGDAIGTDAIYTPLGDDDADGTSDDPNALTNAAATKCVANIGNSAGDVIQNEFVINWELATPALITVTTQETLLEQSLDDDRYSTNVFLVLSPAT